MARRRSISGDWEEMATEEFKGLLDFLGEDEESEQITTILVAAANGEDMSWFDERCEEEHGMSGLAYIRVLLLQRGLQAAKEEEAAEQQRRKAKRDEKRAREQEQARQAEANRVEQQRLKQEADRLAAETRRLAAQRAEAERLAAEREARLEQQRRLAAQKEAERIAKERMEREAAAEKERAAAQRRLAAERERTRQAEEEARLLKQRMEAERQRAQLEAEQRRIQEARRAEAERQKREAAERQKQAEQARIAAEKQEAERQKQARMAAEKQEAERQKQEAEARAAAEKQEAEQKAAAAMQAAEANRSVQTTEPSLPDPAAPVEMPTTGPTLRAWRLQQKLSETEAAACLGVSRSAIYQNEERKGPLGARMMDAVRRKFGLLEEAPAVPQGPGPAYDTLLGSTEPSTQYGILGEADGKLVALDLNQPHTISLFGVQGGGKSYTLGTLIEMAVMPIPQLNHLPNPAATILFHYSATMDYAPEFTSMAAANAESQQLQVLRERYGVEPQALEDLILLVPADKLEERRLEYPMLEVRPLKFSSSELQASHWRFLMGAVGNNSVYIQQVNRIMKQMRNEIALEGLRKAIAASSLADGLKDLANQRLDLASEFIDDQNELGPVLRPGRLLIVDLRDEFLEKDQALGLFVVLMQIFAEVSFNGHSFNKLVVFDEAHKYVKNPELVSGLVESVREMRHKGTTILVASQDPPSVPPQLIELSSQIILHRFNSPAWLKHIQKTNAALSGLMPEQMANLQSGEAYVWSSKATDEGFSKGAKKLRCRPRVTQHGGGTKVAGR